LPRDSFSFPPVSSASDDGLLAIGGDLNPERILHAYRQGIFPWYSEGSPVLWWSPDPRFVLFPENLLVSKSMKSFIRKNELEFSVNRAFTEVIGHCRHINRKGQDGTWITDEMEDAYVRLHELGWAHSAEAWQNGELAGGLYGIRIGQVFFGESMFSLKPNASKYAFIRFVDQLKEQGIKLIDCQVETEHLYSLGATCFERERFIGMLKEWC
jgi:leucyl/phenylalanyl-tRNA--protein transferase